MNILIAKSTAMNCTINIDEELILKNILDLTGSQWTLTMSLKHLNDMYVSTFAFFVSLIVSSVAAARKICRDWLEQAAT